MDTSRALFSPAKAPTMRSTRPPTARVTSGAEICRAWIRSGIIVSPADRELIGGGYGAHRGFGVVQHQPRLHAENKGAEDERREDQDLATIHVGDRLHGRVGDL